MARRSKRNDPETLRGQLVELLVHFEETLKDPELRVKVVGLVPANHLLRDLGSSLIPDEGADAALNRIIRYLLKYPMTIVHGDELMVVSGISEYGRRVRELRKERGWAIASGKMIADMVKTEEEELTEFPDIDFRRMKPDEYVLLSEVQDRDAAHRWKLANTIRRKKGNMKDKLLEFLKANVGRPVTGEELRYVAREERSWPRRTRDLRTLEGWSVSTKLNGRPELPVGVYMLESLRQMPAHDRVIPDPVRRAVLRRDGYACKECGWNKELWNPSDPRHLEPHHVKPHVRGGANTEENLETLCNVCHDEKHRSSRRVE